MVAFDKVFTEGRDRLEWLRDHGRLKTTEDILNRAHAPLLAINFGFGPEVWEVPTLDVKAWNCDRSLRIFVGGRLIVHEGSPKRAAKFLRKCGVELTMANVMW